MSDSLSRVEAAIEAIAAGRIAIVVDAEEREDEGDFICAADKVTPEMIRFMTREGAGLLCMPVLPELARAKGFEWMVDANTTPTETPFAIPVDHASCRTGISPEERHRTVKAILDPATEPDDFVRPGHLFVLFAKEGGVLRRAGHTEATVDLARLAGLTPAGLLCEVCSREGTGMATRDELHRLAREFDLPLVTIRDIIRYRRARETLVHRIKGAEAPLHTRYGDGRIIGYEVAFEDQRPVAVVIGDPGAVEAPLVRMHASCFTGDLLDALRRDGGDPLRLALDAIGAEPGGVLVYLPQEGRGIGVIEELRARGLRDRGAEAAPGFQADVRDYMVGLQILKDLGLRKVRLLTNHPKPADAFVYAGVGIDVVDQVPLPAPRG